MPSNALAPLQNASAAANDDSRLSQGLYRDAEPLIVRTEGSPTTTLRELSFLALNHDDNGAILFHIRTQELSFISVPLQIANNIPGGLPPRKIKPRVLFNNVERYKHVPHGSLPAADEADVAADNLNMQHFCHPLCAKPAWEIVRRLRGRNRSTRLFNKIGSMKCLAGRRSRYPPTS